MKSAFSQCRILHGYTRALFEFDKRGGHEFYLLRHNANLDIEGDGVVVQFYSGSICMWLIIYFQRKF